MTEAEMLARMDSVELSRWFALYQVEAEEAETARHRLDSDDGEVIVHGRDDGDDDGDEPTE